MKTTINEIPRLLRDKQVAELLGCSRSHVWQLVRQERIPPPLKLGRKWTVWPLSI